LQGGGGGRNIRGIKRLLILRTVAKNGSLERHHVRLLDGASKGAQLGLFRALWETGALTLDMLPEWSRTAEGVRDRVAKRVGRAFSDCVTFPVARHLEGSGSRSSST
jgi:hypothetical protein